MTTRWPSVTEASALSLSVKERHVLASIENRLAASDCKLASMLNLFVRLTAGEAMPSRERLRNGWRRAIVARDRRHYRPRAVAGPASRKRARLLMVLWVVVSVGMVAVAAVTSSGGHGSCAAHPALSCAGRQPPHGAHQAAAQLWPLSRAA